MTDHELLALIGAWVTNLLQWACIVYLLVRK
jgi:hypothetical protein